MIKKFILFTKRKKNEHITYICKFLIEWNLVFPSHTHTSQTNRTEKLVHRSKKCDEGKKKDSFAHSEDSNFYHLMVARRSKKKQKMGTKNKNERTYPN